MKRLFEQHKFNRLGMSLIEQANVILENYAAQGYQLTLRQLYYRFVAGDLFPEEWKDSRTGSKNNEASYKKLGDLISRGRMAGLVDWDSLEDRTRTLRSSTHWSHPSEIINAAVKQYQRDLRAGQPILHEVWVEKDALVDVVSRPCKELDVPYFSCRGYVSSSTMYEAGQRMREYMQRKGCEEVHIIHLGDHDPSGIDMTRDIQDRLNLFTGGGVSVIRIALTIEQVRRYNPPPSPAKLTDARASGYIDLYGEDCWELDALEPKTISELISDVVSSETDCDLFHAQEQRMAEERETLKRAGDLVLKGMV